MEVLFSLKFFVFHLDREHDNLVLALRAEAFNIATQEIIVLPGLVMHETEFFVKPDCSAMIASYVFTINHF